MKRGCRAVFVHFHSHPFQMLRLGPRRRIWCGASRVSSSTPGSIWRPLARCSARSWRRTGSLAGGAVPAFHDPDRGGDRAARGAKALVTGESLGQVASQTLENLAVIEDAVEIPSCGRSSAATKRRLSGKHERWQLRDLDPADQDCCSLFVPATRPRSRLWKKSGRQSPGCPSPSWCGRPRSSWKSKRSSFPNRRKRLSLSPPPRPKREQLLSPAVRAHVLLAHDWKERPWNT